MKSKIYKEQERSLFAFSTKGLVVCVVSTIALLYIFLAFQASFKLDSYNDAPNIESTKSALRKGVNNLRSLNQKNNASFTNKDFGPRIQGNFKSIYI
jgi:hypothetical protein